MSQSPLRVLVAGAGLSGLTLARALLARADRPLAVSVVERAPRAGGNIVTERVHGCVVDGSADSWVAAKPEATALCRALGLGAELIETVPDHRRAFVLHRGALVPLPEGLLLGVPTSARAMARTPLLSWRAKARTLVDLALPRRAPGLGDEALGALVARRLGPETASALAEPLLAGIYAGDAGALSAEATFPQLVGMEQRHGSLLRAALAQRAARASHGPASLFTSLRGGVGALTDALLAALPAGCVRLQRGLRALAPLEGGRWRARFDDDTEDTFDRAALAMPMHAAAQIVEGFGPALSRALRAVRFTSAATVFFAFERASIARRLDGTGFLVPRSEGLGMLAATWVSSKWPGRAPDDVALVRGFFGGTRNEALLGAPDEVLVAAARRELTRILRPSAPPRWHRVYRFRETSPQPEPGHAERVRDVRREAAKHPNLHLTGAGYDGVGIPDVVRLAEALAPAMLRP